MEIIKVWSGKLPYYWDITQWSVVHEDKLCILSKQSGERSFISIDLNNMKVDKIKTTSNVILGTYKDQIILGKILDARSHLNLLNITGYKLKDFKKTWHIKESFLFEKYKVPYIKRQAQWNLGKKSIDLVTGNVSAITKGKSEYELVPVELNEDIDIKNFRGSIGNFYFFVDLSENKLLLLNHYTGLEKIIELNDIKQVNKSVFGDFDYQGNTSLNNSTLTSVLINSFCAVWITHDNNVAVHFFNIGKTIEIKNVFKNLDLCLNSITDKKIIIYGIKSYEEGSILIVNVNMEDL
jgi:hypothetical protein